jgi:hypothetical protein
VSKKITMKIVKDMKEKREEERRRSFRKELLRRTSSWFSFMAFTSFTVAFVITG